MLVRAKLLVATCPVPHIFRESPNGSELTGDGGAAAGVRCSDVLGRGPRMPPSPRVSRPLENQHPDNRE